MRRDLQKRERFTEKREVYRKEERFTEKGKDLQKRGKIYRREIYRKEERFAERRRYLQERDGFSTDGTISRCQDDFAFHKVILDKLWRV